MVGIFFYREWFSLGNMETIIIKHLSTSHSYSFILTPSSIHVSQNTAEDSFSFIWFLNTQEKNPLTNCREVKLTFYLRGFFYKKQYIAYISEAQWVNTA